MLGLIPQIAGDPKLKNAVWNTADALTGPALLLATAPFFLNLLGDSEYGTWMLLHSFIGLLGIASLGMGEAGIRYGADRLGAGDPSKTQRFCQTVLTYFLLLAIVALLVGVLSTPLMTTRIFVFAPEELARAEQNFYVGLVWISVKIFQSGCSALLRGAQRYDLTAKVSLTEQGAFYPVAMVMANADGGVRHILGFAIVLSLLASLALVIRAGRLYGGVPLAPLLDRDYLRESRDFRLWSWGQAISAAIFGHLDRISVSAMIGVASMPVYVIPLQIAQLVHGVAAAALAFLFPLTANALARRQREAVFAIFFSSLRFLVVAIAAVTSLIIVIAAAALHSFFSPEFAAIAAPLLKLQIIAFGGMALTIIPYYILNGAGLVKINVYFAALSATLVLILVPIFMREFGLIGGAYARLANLITIVPYLYVACKAAQLSASFWTVFRLFCAYAVPVCSVYLCSNTFELSDRWIMIILAGVLGAALSAGFAFLTVPRQLSYETLQKG